MEVSDKENHDDVVVKALFLIMIAPRGVIIMRAILMGIYITQLQ